MTSLSLKIRRIAASLVLLGILARGVIPAGFMPAMQGGIMQIKICTANGFASIFVPADTAPHAPQPHKAQSDTCPYAPGFTAATLQAPPALPLFDLIAPPMLRLLRAAAKIVFFKPYSAQGPPVT